jgi:hypothetical protein
MLNCALVFSGRIQVTQEKYDNAWTKREISVAGNLSPRDSYTDNLGKSLSRFSEPPVIKA